MATSNQEEFHVILPMVCNHGEEGEADSSALMEEVLNLLFEDSVLTPQKRMETFLTNIIYSLEWEFDGWGIRRIVCDQWAVVVVAKEWDYDYATQEYKHGSSISCDCDMVEHGLAAIWKYLYGKHKIATDEP